jgi:hypothetical protein
MINTTDNNLSAFFGKSNQVVNRFKHSFALICLISHIGQLCGQGVELDTLKSRVGQMDCRNKSGNLFTVFDFNRVGSGETDIGWATEGFNLSLPLLQKSNEYNPFGGLCGFNGMFSDITVSPSFSPDSKKPSQQTTQEDQQYRFKQLVHDLSFIIAGSCAFQIGWYARGRIVEDKTKIQKFNPESAQRLPQGSKRGP